MFHQTPSHSLTLLFCENQPTFCILPLILHSVRTAWYRLQHGDAFKATPSFLLESELFLLPLDLYFKFCTVCFLSSIQTFSLKTLLDNIFSNISHYVSSVKKLLKKSSTISLYWKFTWLN